MGCLCTDRIQNDSALRRWTCRSIREICASHPKFTAYYSFIAACPGPIRTLIMSWNATNCPDGVPEPSTLNIPSNITFAYVPSTNTSNQAFVTCCNPNPVSIADNCFTWCEVPPALDSDQAFSNCLTNYEDGDSRWRHGILGFHEKNGASTASSPRGLFMLGIWALGVVALF
jgi:hypothetical protein